MKFAVKVRYKLLFWLCAAIGSLPEWFLYHPILDITYFFVYKVFKYRLEIVRLNLRKSFPEKSDAELFEIERRFYRHLAEVFVDTIDLVNISENGIKKRVVFENIEEHEKRMAGKNWIAALAHYGAWEYFSIYGAYSTGTIAAVYRPVHNQAVNEFFKYTRKRFGTDLVPMQMLIRYILKNNASPKPKQIILGLLCDQSPPAVFNFTKYPFLNQPTAFFNGMETCAIKFAMPVFFVHIQKVDRARYVVRFEQIYDGVEKTEPDEITLRYAAKLEKMICDRPEWWMWSHRRWK